MNWHEKASEGPLIGRNCPYDSTDTIRSKGWLPTAQELFMLVGLPFHRPRFRAFHAFYLVLAGCLVPSWRALEAQTSPPTVNTIAIATDDYNGLMQASDGNIYTSTNGLGQCADNSDNNCAAIYRITPGGTISVLHQFQESNAAVSTFANADGLAPTALIEGADGNLYGTCAYGGPAGNGTIFKLSLDGTFTLLYSFGAPAASSSSAPTMTGGYEPQSLIQGIDGDLYGVTMGAIVPDQPGDVSGGLFFRITTAGVFTPLHYFSPASGGAAQADGFSSNSLVQADDGNFYVTMLGGVGSALGAIDKVTPDGDVTVWFNFAADYSQGVGPEGPLVEGKDGYLYGVTQSSESGQGGATNSNGYAFKVAANNQFQVLHKFTGGSDGGNVQPPFYLASDGNFYGAAMYGGDLKCPYGLSYGCGGLFQLSPSGTLNPLWSFEGGPATSYIVANNPKVFGANPSAPVVQTKGGLFYGATKGGYESNGTIYSLAMKTAIPAPIQLTFKPSSVVAGNETTLTWTVLNAFSKTAQLCSGHVLPNPEDADSEGVWNNEVQAGNLTNGVYTGSTTITPTVPGAYTFALTCGGLQSGFALLVVTGNSPLKIQNTGLLQATVSQPYTQILVATGGISPYLWVEAGNLPKGLTFDSGAGILSGTPLQYGDYPLAFGVQDSSVPPLMNAVSLSMNVESGLQLSSALPKPTVGKPYSQALMTTGGLPPYQYTLVSGNLPPGLSFNTTAGVVSGTPTEPGTYSVVIQASDSENPKATVSQTIGLSTIGPLKVITPALLPAGLTGVAYTTSLAATGGTPPYSWIVAAAVPPYDQIPPGLTLSTSGTISGTPIQFAGPSYQFNVTVTDSGNPQVSVTTQMSLRITSNLQITVDSLPNVTVGAQTDVPLTAKGGIPPYEWLAASSPKPNIIGVYIDGDVLELDPIIATTALVTLVVSDSEGTYSQVNVTLPLTYLPAPLATSTTLASSNAVAGTGESVTLTATVTVPGGGTPIGPVIFYNGTVSFGTTNLNASGQATLQTSFATPGVYSITAAYGGNASYGVSTSSPVTETVVTPTISAAVNPSSLTIRPGSSGQLLITLTPAGDYTGTVNFSCGTLPAHVSCSFAPPSLTIAGGSGPVTDTLTVTTDAPETAILRQPSDRGSHNGLFAGTAFWLPGSLAAMLGMVRRKRRRAGPRQRNLLRRLWIIVLLCVGLVGSLSSCGGTSHDARVGTYKIPITLTLKGAATQNISATVVVE
jgi:uncharacterized repeat protein (TIGR03803 family)